MSEIVVKRPGVKRFIGIDWNFGALKTAGPRYWAFMAILGIFIGLAAISWTELLRHGGAVLAMRDSSPWGLWFVNYMYYVGLSAGGLVVYASVHLFGAEQYRPLARFAVLQAGVLVMLALLGLLSDMKLPWRAVWFMITPNFTAPFVFTGSAAAIYMIICFIDLWVMITRKGGEKLAHRMTLIALPFAIYLHTTTAFVLALNKSRELWHTAIMVPIFLTSATASGIALLLIFAYIVQHFAGYKFKPSMFRSLSTLLATVIIIDLFLLAVEMIVVFWGTSTSPYYSIRMAEFFTGAYAPIFLPVLALGLTSFVLLSRRSTRHLASVQITAAILYVVAIFFKRYSLLGMGFVYDTLGQFQGVYVPSLVEILLAVGVLAFGIALVTLAVKVLPMEEPESEHGHGHAHGHGDAHALYPAPGGTAPVVSAHMAGPVTERGVSGP
ncbi:MAG: polysulfide reductase NrfD [Clostridiales bacterium]|nr:polysulfide reductase NrfD [Clostridiales bacterium]